MDLGNRRQRKWTLTLVKSEYGAGWVHTEKKFYRQVKHAMGAWVHKELLKTVNNLKPRVKKPQVNR